MADVPTTTRPIHDFLINPTYAAMDDHSRLSMGSERYVYATTAMPLVDDGNDDDNMYSVQAGKQAATAPTTTAEDFRSERVSWRGYASEEEVASPTEPDDITSYSASSDDECASETGEVSYAHHPDAQLHKATERQCGHAQAITMVSAGKAKVVSMPKSVDVSSTPASARLSSLWVHQTAIVRRVRSGRSSACWPMTSPLGSRRTKDVT